MSAVGPKTLKEARALQEEASLLSGEFFLGGGKIEGDTIALFTDSDGETKTVNCIRRTIDGPDEWVKVRISL